MIFYKALQLQTVSNNAEKQEHTQLSDLDEQSSHSLDDFVSLKASASFQSHRRLRESGEIRSRQSSLNSNAMLQQLQSARTIQNAGLFSPQSTHVRGLTRFPSFVQNSESSEDAPGNSDQKPPMNLQRKLMGLRFGKSEVFRHIQNGLSESNQEEVQKCESPQNSREMLRKSLLKNKSQIGILHEMAENSENESSDYSSQQHSTKNQKYRISQLVSNPAYFTLNLERITKEQFISNKTTAETNLPINMIQDSQTPERDISYVSSDRDQDEETPLFNSPKFYNEEQSFCSNEDTAANNFSSGLPSVSIEKPQFTAEEQQEFEVPENFLSGQTQSCKRCQNSQNDFVSLLGQNPVSSKCKICIRAILSKKFDLWSQKYQKAYYKIFQDCKVVNPWVHYELREMESEMWKIAEENYDLIEEFKNKIREQKAAKMN